ncbi:hypothetical protein FQA39_LY13266 [Lamprigera yunnana]|nr:hypothetical protein FQA39_LY13266 [Lamprigera yunnana]
MNTTLKTKETIEKTTEKYRIHEVDRNIGKYFLSLHAQFQCLENKLRYHVEEYKYLNIKELCKVRNELSANIEHVKQIISVAKIAKYPNSDKNVDINIVITQLQDVLNIPLQLSAIEKDTSEIQFIYENPFENLEQYFSIKTENNFSNCHPIVSDTFVDNVTSHSIDYSIVSQPDTKLEDSHSNHSYKSEIKIRSDKFDNIEGWVKSTQNNLQTCEIGDRENIIVTCIETPECFYVQLNRFENIFQDLCYEIQQYLQTAFKLVKEVEIQKLYLVESKNIDPNVQWYRGRVVEFITAPNEETKYKIFFIDYGCTQVVCLKSLQEITLALEKCRPFAYQCKLFDLYPETDKWKHKASQHFTNILSRSNTIMIVMAQSNEVLEVDLLTIKQGDTFSVRDALIFSGLALSHCSPLENSTEHLKSKSIGTLHEKFHTKAKQFDNGDKFVVYICHVNNPHSLYVQVANFSSCLAELHKSMTDYYNEKNLDENPLHDARSDYIYVPTEGMLVATFYNSFWYRGIITNTLKGQGAVRIFLVDSGIKVTVHYTHIRRLLEKFKKLEWQAIHVELADIKPTAEDSSWDKNVIEFLKSFMHNNQLIRLEVVKNETGLCVTLYPQGDDNIESINYAIVKKGFAISTGNMCGKSHSFIDETTSSKKEKPYVLNLMNTIQSTKSVLDEESEPEQENVIRKPVTLLLVKSPDEIYVKVEDAELQKVQNEMHSALQEYYHRNHKESVTWQIGDPCVARDSINLQFYRATILEEKDDNYKVMLKDMGKEIVVPKKNLFILENQFKQFREVAIRCHLAAITPAGDKNKWSALASEFLVNIFEEHKTILMTKCGSLDTNRKSVPVIMWYSEIKSGNALEPSKTILQNINKLLVKNGLAFKVKIDSLHNSVGKTEHNISSSFSSKDTINSQIEILIPKSHSTSENSDVLELSSNFNTSEDKIDFPEVFDNLNNKDDLIDWLPPIPFRSKKFFAMGTFVDNNAYIYLQECRLLSVLKAMEDEMNTYFANSSPEPPDTIWFPGQLCTAKYHLNDKWYRGKIISVVQNTIEVCLIDFGNIEECTPDYLRLKVMYLSVPALANKVELYGVYQKPHCKWLTSDLDELHKQVTDKTIKVLIKDKSKSATVPLAVLKIGTLVVNEYMLMYSTNLVESFEKENIKEDLDDSNTDVIIEEELETTLDDVYIQNPLPPHLIGQKIDVTIISISNYNEVVLEILKDRDIDETKKSFQIITKEILNGADKQPLLQNLKVGKPCIAKFSEDGSWYRAEVIDLTLLDTGFVGVWFVDYGNSENVPSNNIRSLHPNWLRLPILLHKAKLNKITMNNVNCLDIVLSYMEDFCNTLKMAEIISVDPLEVSIYNSNDELIYQDLIDQQLLTKVEESINVT